MPEPKKLIIIGAGGLGIEVHWVARCMNAHQGAGWDILGFADDRADTVGGEHYGIPILCSSADIVSECGADTYVHIAVGSNGARKKLAEQIDAAGLRVATLTHPNMERADTAHLGEGSYVGPFTTLMPECRVGRHVIVNTRSVIGHEAVVGDYSQLAPGAVLTGATVLGEGAFVGANASVYPGCVLGDYASVGGNSFVVRNVEAGTTVMGNPAMPVFSKR